MRPTFDDVKRVFAEMDGGTLRVVTVVTELKIQGFDDDQIRNALDVFIQEGLLSCDNLNELRLVNPS
ncbi:hypothetical protein [Paenalcaligenes suwonensis]|uniref:hypothetical protein n=1 Tax=Paenalcaligenes suwonensis TaxID=1202713 RepID=UPI00140E3B98|nr:hypothetical protein [Paenalcaligenes suwonensis]NHC63187.1 hypothetical protein [Paenalcaligenes suwonensis]